jgi:hypothetical protein
MVREPRAEDGSCRLVPHIAAPRRCFRPPGDVGAPVTASVRFGAEAAVSARRRSDDRIGRHAVVSSVWFTLSLLDGRGTRRWSARRAAGGRVQRRLSSRRPGSQLARPPAVTGRMNASGAGAEPRSSLGRWQLLAEVERGCEVAVEQVPVGLERERRRVVAHPALEA